MTIEELILKWNIPRIIFTDFDGCLTDDRVWVNSLGEEFVAANRIDGLAVKEILKLGVKVVIASSETNKVVTARGNKMGIDVLQGLENKALELDLYLHKLEYKWAQTWYIGNDVNDLGAIEKAGISLSPSDANPVVKMKVDYVLETSGGHGIFREILDILKKITK
jgi:YrbI family 3-deoxy-D-manno-octulosonate 8-phosphate phosphatase